MSTSTEEISTPQFSHAVRGYDRFQVEEYVERLNEWASGALARAKHAERLLAAHQEEIRSLQKRMRQMEADLPSVPEDAVKAAADRAGTAVTSVLREAAEIRKRAAEEADRLVGEAEHEAVQTVESARHSVVELSEAAVRERREARAHAERLVQEAKSEAAEIRRRADEERQRLSTEARAKAEQVAAAAEGAARSARQRSADERRLSEESLARLHTERAQIVRDLSRLRGAIQSLITDPPVELEGRPDENPDTTALVEVVPGDGRAGGAAGR